jgi:large subunit ribosomal protein L40
MHMVLLQSKSLRALFEVHRTAARHYARKAVQSDPKKDIIRRSLYPSNVKSSSAPTGAWRIDVGRALQRAIPSVQVHETIERAWLLHKRHIRKSREKEIQRKFQCMKRAMDELHDINPILYEEANKREDPKARSDEEKQLLKQLKGTEARALEARIRGLFPREMKVPSDTPSREGWNYKWTAPFPRPM